MVDKTSKKVAYELRKQVGMIMKTIMIDKESFNTKKLIFAKNQIKNHKVD